MTIALMIFGLAAGFIARRLYVRFFTYDPLRRRAKILRGLTLSWQPPSLGTDQEGMFH